MSIDELVGEITAKVTQCGPMIRNAGKAICGHAINGWQFWQCERAPGAWVKLQKLRR